MLWRLPEIGFFAAFLLPASIRPWIWLPALTWAGASCVANALHCGRLHCYLTGPFFLLGAAALGIYELAAANLPDALPTWIALTEIAGGLLLILVPERVWGLYRARPALAGLADASGPAGDTATD